MTVRTVGALAVGAALAALGGCADLEHSSSGPAEHHAAAALPVDQDAAAGRVSAWRHDHGLGAVTVDPALQRVAQAQAVAMAAANRMSHTVAGPLPRRLGALAAERHAYVENVAAGYSSLESVVVSWQRSPQHNENLLFRPMRRVGIAAATAPGTRYKTFWSLVMTD